MPVSAAEHKARLNSFISDISQNESFAWSFAIANSDIPKDFCEGRQLSAQEGLANFCKKLINGRDRWEDIRPIFISYIDSDAPIPSKDDFVPVIVAAWEARCQRLHLRSSFTLDKTIEHLYDERIDAAVSDKERLEQVREAFASADAYLSPNNTTTMGFGGVLTDASDFYSALYRSKPYPDSAPGAQPRIVQVMIRDYSKDPIKNAAMLPMIVHQGRDITELVKDVPVPSQVVDEVEKINPYAAELIRLEADVRDDLVPEVDYQLLHDYGPDVEVARDAISHGYELIEPMNSWYGRIDTQSKLLKDWVLPEDIPVIDGEDRVCSLLGAVSEYFDVVSASDLGHEAEYAAMEHINHAASEKDDGGLHIDSNEFVGASARSVFNGRLGPLYGVLRDDFYKSLGDSESEFSLLPEEEQTKMISDFHHEFLVAGEVEIQDATDEHREARNDRRARLEATIAEYRSHINDLESEDSFSSFSWDG